jgi:hypothetical protein
MFGTRDPVVSIEVIPFDNEVFNLSVDEDETFVLNGIVTHNCLCFMTSVEMEPDDFVDQLRGWVRGESKWPDMDRYAADYGGITDPPLNDAGASNLPTNDDDDLPSNVDALDDWLNGDEETLDKRMGL